MLGVDAVEDVDDALHVVLLVAQAHDRGQRDVAADRDVVAVGDFLGLDDVDVLVDGDGIGLGLAHALDVTGGIAADEEGGERALLADVVEDLGVGLDHVLVEIVRGDLGNQRIDQRDDVHAGLDVVVGHLHRGACAEREQLGDLVLEVVHVGEDLVAAQVGCERERTANQAVQRGRVADLFLHAAHDLEHVRDAAGFLGRDLAVARRLRRLLVVLGLERVAGDRRRVVVCPSQIAAEALRFDLQVEDDRLTVGTVQLVDLEQRLDCRIGVGQELGCRVSLEVTCMDAAERHPRGTLDFLVLQRAEQKFLAHSLTS